MQRTPPLFIYFPYSFFFFAYEISVKMKERRKLAEFIMPYSRYTAYTYFFSKTPFMVEHVVNICIDSDISGVFARHTTHQSLAQDVQKKKIIFMFLRFFFFYTQQKVFSLLLHQV